MLLSLLLLIVLCLTVADGGPLGVALRRWLVQEPVRRLARVSRGRAVGIGLIVLLGVAAIVLFETEGVRLFSMAAPDMIAWVLMFDVTVIFDLVILAISLRAAAGWRGVVRQRDMALGLIRALIGRIGREARSRSARARKPRPTRSLSNEDEPDAGFAFA
ncbi:hypothetical protein [Brevundimonas sp. SORGH_AS_0993]|uniref:hypothetical protein n=1 Tax=Brevundimonas sp. SORGH_AS_0993 TaxID=3041794 RepID=UPI0027866FD7|nr:hypothetical protein [Brevundimonas sp. SORGH_AS_0993]MDQ1154762.1 hypothetical protein [Brevundimonas sp. SORGH_AS_0993]